MDGPVSFSITQVAPLNNYSGLTQNVNITNPAAAAAAGLAINPTTQSTATPATTTSSVPAAAWIFGAAVLLWLLF